MDTLEKNITLSTQNLNPATAISHSFQEETLEAKARWFQSLTLNERMEMLCMFTDMILNNNPRIMEQKNVKPVTGRIRVLSQS
ncbi:MAG: hypothetical protein M5U34_00625 [Chloroflexi bacterium]|nr:hypothetical protein [Chloroflexota bacterium]